MALVSMAVPYSYVERVVPAQPAVAREHVGAQHACTAELNARETNGEGRGDNSGSGEGGAAAREREREGGTLTSDDVPEVRDVVHVG